MNKKDKEFAVSFLINQMKIKPRKKDLQSRLNELIKEYGDEYQGYRRCKIHSAIYYIREGDEQEARNQLMKMRDKDKHKS